MHWREIEPAREDLDQLLPVVGDAPARAAERERGTDDHGEADLAAKLDAVLDVVDEHRLRRVEADLCHCIFEEQAVFRLFDRLKLRADEFDVVLLEYATIGKFDGEVESG